MLATLSNEKTEGRKLNSTKPGPISWRYAYLFNCEHFFYATCSFIKSDDVIDIIIISNKNLIRVLERPGIKIHHIYLITSKSKEGRFLQIEEVKSIYRNDSKSCRNITLELKGGHLLNFSKDGQSEQKNRVFFSEDHACDQKDLDILA